MKHTRVHKVIGVRGSRGVVTITSDDPQVVAVGAALADAVASFGDDMREEGGAMPQDDPARDDAAWLRLGEVVGKCRCPVDATGQRVALPGCPVASYMLMYHCGNGTAAFKHRETRRYTFA